MATQCDTITVEQPEEDKSRLEVTSVSASVGSDWDSINVTVNLENVVTSGEGETITQDIEIDASEAGYSTRTESVSVMPGSIASVETTLEGAPEGEYQIYGISNYNEAWDTVVIEQPAEDDSNIVITDTIVESQSENEVYVEFALSNSVISGDGAFVESTYEVIVAGNVVEDGTVGLSSGMEEVFDFTFTDIDSGNVSVQITTQSDSVTESVSVQGSGGDGGGDSPLGGLPAKQVAYGTAALAGIALLGSRGNSNRPRTRGRRE